MISRKIQAGLHLFSLLIFALTWLPPVQLSTTADVLPQSGAAETRAQPVFVYQSSDEARDFISTRPGGGYLQDDGGDKENHPPNAKKDSATTQAGVAVEISVLSNDHDPDKEDTLYLESFQETSLAGGRITRIDRGTPGNTSDDRLKYSPPSGFSGSDSFHYTISDGRLTDSTDVSVTVSPGAAEPEAKDDHASTDEDAPVTTDVLANDSGVSSSSSVRLVQSPNHGQAEVESDRRVTYAPERDFHGTDQYRYEVCSSSGNCSQAHVLISITPQNDAPSARNDSAAARQGESITIDVLANDRDADGDSLNLVSLTQPGNGSASITNNQARYTPEAGYSGSDSFTYTAEDGSGAAGTATVSLTVEKINHPPQARKDSAATQEGVAVDIHVLANDHDPDTEDSIYLESFESTTQAGGRVSRLDGGTPGDTRDDRLRYTPPAGFFGDDSFQYTVSDGQLTDSDIVTISVQAVPPAAKDDSVSTKEDSSVKTDVLANDSNIGQSPTVRIVQAPEHGQVQVESDLQVTYTPARDFFGMDQYRYEVCSAAGRCSQAQVTISVTPVNDAPVARDDTGTTSEGTAVDIPVLANDSDVDGDALAIQKVNPASGGSAEPLPNGQIRFTPAPGFSGTASFSYIVHDGHGGTDTAQVRVTVNNVDYAPVARDDTVTTEAGAAVRIPVLSNDSDLDGDVILLASFDSTSVAGGQVSRIDRGTPADTSDDLLLYDPPDGFSGEDSFTYTASDGDLTDEATVYITVNPASPVPIANPDTYSTREGTALEVDASHGVLSNDVGADDLVANLAANPSHGALELNPDGSFTYTPVAGFTGEDSFQYRAGAGEEDSSPAAVIIQVNPRPATPVANGDLYTMQAEGDLVVPAPGVLENDNVADDVPLQAVLVDEPAHGDIQLNSNGSFTYTPGTDFIGEDTFTYAAETAESRSSPAKVIVRVPDLEPPSLTWVSPGSDEERIDVSETPVQLEVLVEDNLGIAGVVFLRWDAPVEEFVTIGRIEAPPYQVTIDPTTLNPAWNQVFAIAIDGSGNQSNPVFIWLYRLETPAEEIILYMPLIHK